MKQMGYLMKNAVTRAFRVDTHRSFKVTTSRLCEACLVLVQHPLPGIWNVSLRTGDRGDVTGRANSTAFRSWKWSWGKWCIQTHNHLSIFVSFSPMYTFRLLYCWTIMKKIPDITLGWIAKLLIFDSFLTNKEIHFMIQFDTTLPRNISVHLS